MPFCWFCHDAASDIIEPLQESFLPYANNKGIDQSAYTRSLISAFGVRCSDRTITGERGCSVVECRTPEREDGGSKPTAAVLCPWARHFTPRKYWLMTQEAVAPSRHDWKIVDWDVKPQHKNDNYTCCNTSNTLDSFRRWTGRFEFYLVRNSWRRVFSCNVDHRIMYNQSTLIVF